MDATTPDQIERHLAALQDSLTTPQAAECVFCFVDRMLDAFGCDTTLRWTARSSSTGGT
jgi:hypothetical protein